MSLVRLIHGGMSATSLELPAVDGRCACPLLGFDDPLRLVH